MQRALEQVHRAGNPYLDSAAPEIFADEDFRAGKFDTKFMERFLARRQS